MPFFTSAKPVSRHGRPGTIRAIIGGVVVVMLGGGTLTGLRMMAVDNGSNVAQARKPAPAKSEIALQAMSRLASPPAPGAFSIGEMPEDTQVLLTSEGASPAIDCVKELDQVLSTTTVEFDEDSSEILPAHISQMARIGDLIMACDGAYVMVGGHADGSGDDAANLALSWDRADRTLNHLLLLGVDPFAVEAVGYGARAPLSQGSDEEDSADRRVDFRVMRKP